MIHLDHPFLLLTLGQKKLRKHSNLFSQTRIEGDQNLRVKWL